MPAASSCAPSEPGIRSQDEETIRNSYAADDEVNKLDWQLRADNDDMVEYIKGLIALRKARYEFRLGDRDSVAMALDFTDGLPARPSPTPWPT